MSCCFKPSGMVVNVLDQPNEQTEEAHTDDEEGACSCGPVHRHNCCLKTKHFLESSAFSFTLGTPI